MTPIKGSVHNIVSSALAAGRGNRYASFAYFFDIPVDRPQGYLEMLGKLLARYRTFTGDDQQHGEQSVDSHDCV